MEKAKATIRTKRKKYIKSELSIILQQVIERIKMRYGAKSVRKNKFRSLTFRDGDVEGRAEGISEGNLLSVFVGEFVGRLVGGDVGCNR